MGRFYNLWLAAVFVAGFGTAAHAFSETPVAPAPSGAPAPAIVGIPGQESAALAPEPGTGETEINIPGVGSVGSLPKMDFGLELLYGAQGDDKIADPVPSNNDVLVRGTLKHRF